MVPPTGPPMSGPMLAPIPAGSTPLIVSVSLASPVVRTTVADSNMVSSMSVILTCVLATATAVPPMLKFAV